MWKYVGRRLIATVPVLLAVSVVVFGLTVLIPGDPAVSLAGENPSPELIDRIRTELGLNEPLWRQYTSWLWDAIHLDLGQSFRSSQTVWDAIRPRLPVTISLTLVTLLLATVVGLAGGLIAGRRSGGLLDKTVTGMASLGVAIPHFWIGFILISVFAIQHRLLPPNGYVSISEGVWEWFKHLLLPSIALAAASAAEIARQSRASIIGCMGEDYVRTARSKGLPNRTVVGKHALKNAAVPIVTVIGLQFSRLIGGAVVVEQVFGLPGIGQLAFQSVAARDMPVVQGTVMVAAIMVILANLVVDLSYGFLNPKLRVP
jgi:peptide/nickel transport system permease protein